MSGADVLRAVERVLDERVVQGAQHRPPPDRGPEVGSHLEVVDELRPPGGREAKLVETTEASGTFEPEADAPAGLVVLHPVADRAVAAARADLQGTVERRALPWVSLSTTTKGGPDDRCGGAAVRVHGR